MRGDLTHEQKGPKQPFKLIVTNISLFQMNTGSPFHSFRPAARKTPVYKLLEDIRPRQTSSQQNVADVESRPR